MPFVLKFSVRLQFAAIILLAIVSAWLLSAGLSNYLYYLRDHAQWEEMRQNPAFKDFSLPEPQFRVGDIVSGPSSKVIRRPAGTQPPGLPEPPPPPPPPPPPSHKPQPVSNSPWHTSILLGNAGIALLLALLAGTWLGYRFTRPLGELIKGTKALQAGNLDYRIPLEGDNDFARMAEAINRMAESLQGHIRELEQDALRRKQLLADVAHELRGPVMTLQTMCGAMADGLAEEPERRTQAVGSLVRSTSRLSHLVTDLLELARLDLKELPIQPQCVELNDLVRILIQNQQPAARQHGLVLHELAPGLPVAAFADPDRTGQILDNLLDNAIRYAGAGAEIQVSLLPGDPVRIVVSDTGKGIDPEHLPFVCDPFYRADPVRTPGDAHCGLGLSIARGLAEAQGGSLDLSSEPGKGTTAVVRLPGG